MARLIRSFRRSLILSSSSSKTPIHQLLESPTLYSSSSSISNSQTVRSYTSDMRKTAFESNILRLLRNEIQYELDRSPPLQPVTEFNSFLVEERPGEQWIRLRRKFAEDEDIKIEVTMFDGSVPAPKSTDGTPVEDVQLHITFIVNISKGGRDDILEFLCSAWSDSMEIQKVFIHGHDQMPTQPYMGPEFKELDDDLQNSLYEFLEARNINDELAVFLHKYVRNKDKTEFIRWMGIVKSFIERK